MSPHLIRLLFLFLPRLFLASVYSFSPGTLLVAAFALLHWFIGPAGGPVTGWWLIGAERSAISCFGGNQRQDSQCT